MPSRETLMADFAYVRNLASNAANQLTILRVNCRGTPRWNKHLQSTLNIFQEIADQEAGDADLTHRNITALYDELKSHWNLIFGDPFDTARMYTQMSIFKEFLRSKFLEDYTEKRPPLAHPHILLLGKCKGNLEDRERAAKELSEPLANLDDFYRQSVDLAVQELGLDPDHVQSKFRAAAGREGEPGSDIKPLIDHCDWTRLAEVLVKDRMMAGKLFRTLDDDQKLCDKVISGINRTQKRYFDSLANPSRFVISARAGALAAKAVNAEKAEASCLLPPPYTDSSSNANLESGPSYQTLDEKRTAEY
jgi:hypothetical protein